MNRWLIGIILICIGWGALMWLALDPPLSIVLALIGGGVIGFTGGILEDHYER